MKKIIFFLALFTFHFSLFTLSAQSDSAKPAKKKPYKQGPSYMDANLYKLPRPVQDTANDSIALKKKFNIKYVSSPFFGPVTADCEPNADLALANNDGTYFEKLHSVAWFEFTAPEDTTLTFDIAPDDKNDDIDFLLFKDEGGSFLNALASHGNKPIRSNIAACDKTLYGKTGLNNKSKNQHEKPGKHPAYSKSLSIKKGERFYLAIDNYTRAKGPFTLFLHLRWPALIKPPPPVKPPQTTDNPKVNIIVVDSAGMPIRVRLKIAGAIAHKVIDTSNTAKYSLTLGRRQRIKITGIAKGYILSQSYFTVPLSGNEFNDTIRFIALKSNEAMVLQDIEFEPDLAVFIPTSLEPLSNLLAFMQSNSSTHIVIKGYVNDPQQINTTSYDMDLSERRAKAVLQYLVEHGIDNSRMDWKGYGAKDMLYPNPQSLEEQQANRRVEIEVK